MEDRVFRHGLAGVAGEAGEQIHRAGLERDQLLPSLEAVEAGIDGPLTESKSAGWLVSGRSSHRDILQSGYRIVREG